MRIAIVNDTIGETSGSNQACARMAGRLASVGCTVAWIGMPDSTFDRATPVMRDLARRGVRLVALQIAPAQRSAFVIAQRVVRSDACQQLADALEKFDADLAVVCNVHNVLSAAAIRIVEDRCRETVFFPFDNWFWCVRKYNHVPGEEGPCRACVDGPTAKAFVARCGGGRLATATSSAVNHWLWSAGGLRRVDAWICATSFHVEVLARRGVKGEKAIEDVQFPLEAGLASALTTVEGPLAYYGSTAACKGLQGLASALAHCRGVSIELFVAEPPDQKLNRALAVAAARNEIRIETSLRWNSGLRERISKARAIVIPSSWDSVGEQVLFEAQALGKAVIASDIEVHRRMVVPGETGWLAGGKQGRALAACLEEAWASPETAEALGAEARRRLTQTDARWPDRFIQALSSVRRASAKVKA